MKSTRVTRKGTSLIEVLIATTILAFGLGAILQLGTGETRRVHSTRERLVAQAELKRLDQAFQAHPALYFASRGLLEATHPEDFTALHATLLDEHPLLAGPLPDGLERAVLSEPTVSGGYRLTFLVRYRVPGGATRELSSRRYVD